MTYKEALAYLESFINYEKIDGYNYRSSLKLDRMKRFVSLLEDPQKDTRSVHIAGTKGKGSTASYVHSILTKSGFRTGLYTSPHLTDFRERVRIGNDLISEKDLTSILAKVKEVVERSMKDDRPSFFEIYTALAYMYFKEKKCDFAVYEVGLGGRLDATNVIEPLVSVITPLSYEHMDKLGGTLARIAAEKCGIIKKNSICISAPQEKEALKVIEKNCSEKNSRLFLLGKDITFTETYSNESEQVFNIHGMSNEYPLLKSHLIGQYQIINAATAVGVIEALKLRGISIPMKAVREGIECARWEGRLEVISREPYIVFDGAQNKASAGALAAAIKKIFKYKKLVLVLGVSKDKDISGILEELMPISDSIVLTRSSVTERAMDAERIKEAACKTRSGHNNILMTSNVREALENALLAAGKEDLILVTGSLFVIGDAKAYFAVKGSRECIKV